MEGTRQRKPQAWRTRARGEPRGPGTPTPETPVQVPGLRFYSPGLGRWLNRDPIGELGGANGFRSFGDDAISNTDVLGLAPVVDFQGLCGFFKSKWDNKEPLSPLWNVKEGGTTYDFARLWSWFQANVGVKVSIECHACCDEESGKEGSYGGGTAAARMEGGKCRIVACADRLAKRGFARKDMPGAFIHEITHCWLYSHRPTPLDCKDRMCQHLMAYDRQYPWLSDSVLRTAVAEAETKDGRCPEGEAKKILDDMQRAGTLDAWTTACRSGGAPTVP